jgi:hypothetical protein
MENNTDPTILDLTVDEESKMHFAGIAQWARLNAIVGFIALGVSILSTALGIVRLSSYEAGVASGSGLFGLIFTIAISLALNITLIGAAGNIKKGIDLTDQGYFGLGLSKLATYFRIVGIFTIIVLVVVVLALLVVIIAGAVRGTIG